MSRKHLENVSFDFIRYANCWEDADVLIKGLDIQSNSIVISIASAGDNCFALLGQSPEKVIAVDISAVQLYLTELKKTVIKELDYEDFLTFLGFKPSTNRLKQFQQIKDNLSAPCRAYWTQHRNEIEQGVIHLGKFEKYFQLFKNEVLPTVHDQKTVDELFAKKSQEEQLKFHDQQWHTPSWEKMYRHFFGVEMMGSQGRDPEFLKHVQGSVPDLILAREMEHLRLPAAQTNYFLYYILNNTFHTDFLPYYARPENFDSIRQNLDALVLHEGLLGSAMKNHPKATHFNLSDIFEYMDDNLFKTVANEIIHHSAPEAKLAYWNLMIPRRISFILPRQVKHLKTISETLKNEDLGYFYGDFIIEQKAPLV